jgi:hypothetical protein
MRGCGAVSIGGAEMDWLLLEKKGRKRAKERDGGDKTAGGNAKCKVWCRDFWSDCRIERTRGLIYTRMCGMYCWKESAKEKMDGRSNGQVRRQV